VAVRCTSCGEENPDRAKFCLACGQLLEATQPAADERKVVSVLFVDLVGFTAASESADPEDVRARLQRYHARAKSEIERYGGTVEKFVGDAVMAVFGAPVAHEDDAERAVRAALAILEAMEELELEARAAVNTGEAVVSLGARPERGEGIATGDVVNTAARLQTSAPPGSVVVGEQTYSTTRYAIDYEPREPVAAKGKAEPIPLWRAIEARSRFGVDVAPAHATPFVGRNDELDVVRQLYARTVRESECHLLTLVGEPGIGKSRLVAELSAFVDAQPELVSWRQGRCLPYGDGIAFWALGEIVKAHTGVLESDTPAAAREKLDRVVQSLSLTPAEAGWVAGELGGLVGAARAEGGGTRDESFAAWRTFLEAVAAQRPLVLVIEDLHWADAALLEFLEYLVDWSTGVPLLVICTARPELYQLHGTWSGGKRNASTISLSPLSSDDTARLISALLERAVVPADTQQQLLERAGGNPLYAEQFVRMLGERGAGSDVGIPDTIQAVIAARLDTLGSERKALLQDAAVVGKVFWVGAVASIAGREEDAVRAALHELARRDLIRAARRSSVEGQAEYAFVHGLVRDVAYGQIPRAARARKHEAAARWIEEIAGDRVVDHADVLAHHYREALSLAAAAGLETARLEGQARRFLALAAERAASLDARLASALYEEALALTKPGDPGRGRLLIASVDHAGDFVSLDDALSKLEEAVVELEAANDQVGVGKAMLLLAHYNWVKGDALPADRFLLDGVALLEQHEPGPELAHAYAMSAGRDAIRALPHDAISWAEKGIALAERLGLDNFAQRSRQFRGLARCSLGDLGGLDDLCEALETALDRGWTRETVVAYNNYGSWVWLTEGAEDAMRIYRDAIAFAERRGWAATWTRGELTWVLFDSGSWDELLVTADALENAREMGQPQLMARASKARVLFFRGQKESASELARELLPQARTIADPQILLPTLSLAALVERDATAAVALVEEMLAIDAPENPMYVDPARVCVRHGAIDLAERMVRSDERAAPRARHVGATVRAILAEHRGDSTEAVRLYAEAAEQWKRYPFVLERAQCLLGEARCLSAAGRPGASGAAEEARDLFVRLGAAPLEREAAETVAAAA
jgi:class 3 adenylate cyclase